MAAAAAGHPGKSARLPAQPESGPYGRNREYALGDTPEQRSMGAWSDGTPVRELVVTDTP